MSPPVAGIVPAAGGLCWMKESHERKDPVDGIFPAAGGLCWKEEPLERQVPVDGILPDAAGLVSFDHEAVAMHYEFEDSVPKSFWSSTEAAAASAVEVVEINSAAASSLLKDLEAFSRSPKVQVPVFSPLAAKKKFEKVSFFVKTLEGKTKVVEKDVGDKVSCLLAAVEGAAADCCYVMYNGKILNQEQSLEQFGKDTTFRICGRISEGGSTRKTSSS